MCRLMAPLFRAVVRRAFARDGPRYALVGQHHEPVTRVGWRAKSRDCYWRRGTHFVDGIAARRVHSAYAPEGLAGQETRRLRATYRSATSTHATVPSPRVISASITAPRARFFGLPFNSSSSASRRSNSINSVTPSLVLAEIFFTMVLPPHCSSTNSYLVSSCRMRSGLSVGLINLIYGYHDRHFGGPGAWSMASMVCGITPSSAATTRITISVTLAPRARICVNASWPGVSRKTTRPSLMETS